jgi:hypothetical protein
MSITSKLSCGDRSKILDCFILVEHKFEKQLPGPLLAAARQSDDKLHNAVVGLIESYRVLLPKKFSEC